MKSQITENILNMLSKPMSDQNSALKGNQQAQTETLTVDQPRQSSPNSHPRDNMDISIMSDTNTIDDDIPDIVPSIPLNLQVPTIQL